MSVRSVWRRFIPRTRHAAPIGVCILLVLGLTVGRDLLRNSPVVAATPAATEQALRDRVANFGWVRARVDLNRPTSATVPPLPADWDRAAQNLLLGLSAGSYDTPLHVPGESSLTVRVNGAALDQVLTSPLVAGVAAAGNADMPRLAAGYHHSLAIGDDGRLWAWGANNVGQLGVGSTANRVGPVQVMTSVAAVAAGDNYSLAIRSDGSLWAWGYNAYGELGDAANANRSIPIQILTGVAAVAAGGYHGLALKRDGSLLAWGYNAHGAVGDGTTTNRSDPVQVLTGVAAVAAGNLHTLALKTDGSLWAWGNNSYGQLGDGTTVNQSRPIQVPGLFTAVAAGSYHTLALKTDGSMWVSGWTGYGNQYLNPAQVLSVTVAMAGGDSHTLAIRTDGYLWARGANDYGQVGDGTTIGRLSPLPVLAGVTAMSAGFRHTLALRTDGSLFAWGRNDDGQLGNGPGMSLAMPISLPIPGFGPWPDLAVTSFTLTPQTPSAGAAFSAAVTVTNRGNAAGNPGTLQVWADQPGAATCGALGNGSATLPTLAVGASQTVTINGLTAGAAGAKTLRAFIDSACLTAESDETNNQSATPYTVVPQNIDLAVTSITLSPDSPTANGTFDASVTVTNRGTAATAAGVSLQVWAHQTAVPGCGAVGDRSATLPSIGGGASHTVTFTGLPAGAAGLKNLRIFVESTCAIPETDDTNNHALRGYTVVAPAPDLEVSEIVVIPRTPRVNGTFTVKVTVVNEGTAAGAGHLLVWANRPAAVACGAVGDQTITLPSLAPGASQTFTVSGLAAGALGIKVLRAFVDAECLIAGTADSDDQAAIGYQVGNPDMQRVAAGDQHSLAIKPDGSLWAWGANGSGELGDGTTTYRANPIQVQTGVSAVAAGYSFTLALKTDGSLWAWGANGYGQLGDGMTTNRSIPFQILTGVAALAAGDDHALALKTDGSLWTWGLNASGQLGDGTTTNKSAPVQVLTGVAAIAAGYGHTLALKNDGTLLAWGFNTFGTLGNGTTSNTPSPVQVLTGVAAIAAGTIHSLALKADGSLWAWGYNYHGQLGDGTNTSHLSPVPVLSGVAAVAAGNYHTLAIKTDASLWSWGSNANGALGDGMTSNRRTPFDVLTGVAAMAGGGNHTLAIKTDGSLWAWGANLVGQVGDGTNTDQLTPVRVPVPGFGTTPDFAMTSVVLTPSSPSAGGLFDAAITVRNQGTAAGNPGTLQFWTDQPSAANCAAVGNRSATLSTLAAGASQTVTLSGLSAGAAGSKTLRAFVDSACQTAESDETNNQYAAGYTVAQVYYTLTVNRNGTGSGTVGGGGSYAYNTTVIPTATAATGSTFAGWSPASCASAFPLTANTTCTATFTLNNYSLTVGKAGNGSGTVGGAGSYAYNTTVAPTATAATGSTFAGWTPAGCASAFPLTANTTCTATFTLKNYTLSVGWGGGGTVAGGGTYAYNTMVTPTASAAPGWTFGGWNPASCGSTFALIADTTCAAFFWLNNYTLTVAKAGAGSGTVGGGGTYVYNTQVTPTAVAATGSAFTGWTPASCGSPFALTANTTCTATFIPSAPDFEVTEIVLTPRVPRINGTFAAKITVVNQGTAAGVGRLQVWADQPAIQTCGAVGNQTITLPSLAPGASQTVTVSGLPAGALGFKTLRAFLDNECLTDGTDDSDDQTTIRYLVGNPDMERIGAGSGYSLFVEADGGLWTWGENAFGQLGDGTRTNRPKPVRVLSGVMAAVAGDYHTLALKADGTLWAWGYNWSGQLGDGTTTDRPRPGQVVLTGVVAIAAGSHHSLALKADGSLWAWGYGALGQLGDGAGTARLTPVQVMTGVAGMTAGQTHSLAIKTDGSLWAWGANAQGQLGDGSTSGQLRPVPVPVLTGAVALAAGDYHTLVLKSDGSLWAWGYNGQGQLGDGTTTHYLSPHQVMTGVATVAAGPSHSLALKTDGSLWTWGWNQNGQLGDGTTADRLNPTPIMSGVSAAAAGTFHTVALKTDGSLRAWGNGFWGQLGDGTTTERRTPVPVGGIVRLPDLVVSNVVLTPASPLINATFNAAVTVTNRGAVAGLPRTLQVWANQPTAPACGAVGNKAVAVASLAAGASTTVTVVGVPAGVAGAKTLRAFIDSACLTPEADDTNNQFTTGYSVLAPDFVVSRVVLTPAGPVRNSTFSAAVTITNQGNAAGLPRTLQLWASQPTAPLCGAVGNKALAIPSLAAGASTTVTVAGLSAGVAGAKTLRAVIDSACLTAESNEANNQTTLGYTVN